MPLGEGVARAMERDDARSPLTTTLNNNQLDKATSGGYGGQWRGQARAEREGGRRGGGRKQWGGGMGMMAGGGERKDAARAPRHDKQPGVRGRPPKHNNQIMIVKCGGR
jgi:hypothetical protein